MFAFEAQLTRQIRHDFWETFSELFNRHHVRALRDWAHSLGMTLRVQPYGLQTDAIASAAILDLPEGESLGFKNLDDFRCLAGGRDMAGHTVLSCEAGAYNGTAYSTTWDRFLRTMGGAYAAGVNQTVVHGFSYATAPGASWPGFAAFSPYNGGPGYGESWGPRQPTWQHMADISAYLGRVHGVLQSGTARADVAVFRQTGYAATGIGASWFTATGVPLGWTHQFLSGPLLDLPSATVSGGRLAPNGPAYKALFVEGDFFYGSTPTLAPADARHLLRLAEDGLPIVLLGAFDQPLTPGVPDDGDTDRLHELLTRLLSLPHVTRITDKAAVGDALTRLGVTPDVRHATASTLLNAHRVTRDADFYYLCNGKHAETVKPPVAAIDHEVTLRHTRRTRGGMTIAYLLDPWTGEATRIARYTEDDGDVTVRVTLQPGQVMIVALGRPGLFGDRNGARPHAIATDAPEMHFGARELTIRSTTAGTYTTRLSSGRTVTTTVPSVPAPITPGQWRLDVEDWRPGSTPTRTERVHRTLTLDTLMPWSRIPELADSSGIGRYRTTIDLPPDWDSSHGARLELGQVSDTARVTVNGTCAPPLDRLQPVVDVGPLLRRGRNVIEVEVATPSSTGSGSPSRRSSQPSPARTTASWAPYDWSRTGRPWSAERGGGGAKKTRSRGAGGARRLSDPSRPTKRPDARHPPPTFVAPMQTIGRLRLASGSSTVGAWRKRIGSVGPASWPGWRRSAPRVRSGRRGGHRPRDGGAASGTGGSSTRWGRVRPRPRAGTSSGCGPTCGPSATTCTPTRSTSPATEWNASRRPRPRRPNTACTYGCNPHWGTSRSGTSSNTSRRRAGSRSGCAGRARASTSAWAASSGCSCPASCRGRRCWSAYRTA